MKIIRNAWRAQVNGMGDAVGLLLQAADVARRHAAAVAEFVVNVVLLGVDVVVARVGRPRSIGADDGPGELQSWPTGRHAAGGMCTIVEPDWSPLSAHDRAAIAAAVRKLAGERAALVSA